MTTKAEVIQLSKRLRIAERLRDLMAQTAVINKRSGANGQWIRSQRTFLRREYAPLANDAGMTPDELLTLLENGGDATDA